MDAAALSAVGAAATGVLRDGVRLRPGERILIRGANGGIGTAAVQIARALGGRVTALASSQHLDRLRSLGVEEAFDYHPTDPRELGRFDVVLDPVAKGMQAYRRLLMSKGRMAAMATSSPRDVAYLVASLIYGGRRVQYFQIPPTAELLTALAGNVDGKSVVPVVEAVYALDDITAAHRAGDQRRVR
ncbi:MAG TPA: zinc-binding dehydrogenase [Streptosporangiaceae bacterium]|nr:zinc-binding dehydrogenase [Streptosporangiaceae bacterium]